jgi:hypothetical protein
MFRDGLTARPIGLYVKLMEALAFDRYFGMVTGRPW